MGGQPGAGGGQGREDAPGDASHGREAGHASGPGAARATQVAIRSAQSPGQGDPGIPVSWTPSPWTKRTIPVRSACAGIRTADRRCGAEGLRIDDAGRTPASRRDAPLPEHPHRWTRRVSEGRRRRSTSASARAVSGRARRARCGSPGARLRGPARSPGRARSALLGGSRARRPRTGRGRRLEGEWAAGQFVGDDAG